MLEPLCVCEQVLGRGRRDDSIGGSIEQARSQRVFEGVEPPAHGRCIHTEASRRAAQGSRATKRQKDAHVVPVESALRYCRHVRRFCGLKCMNAKPILFPKPAK